MSFRLLSANKDKIVNQKHFKVVLLYIQFTPFIEIPERRRFIFG